MACPIGADSQSAIHATQLGEVQRLCTKARESAEPVHIPDLLAVWPLRPTRLLR
jgi:hypothetical protein